MWIFINIITFFHRQIMCGCRLITCLYDIRQTSYECRLHHSLVAPSEPIWATFAPILGKYIPTADSSRHDPTELPQPFAPGDPIIYTYIFAGENSDAVIRTRAHEKIRLDFSRAKPVYVLYIAICTVYCWEKCKKCNVRSCLCPLDPSIFHFILIKYGGKIWQLELSNLICKKIEIAWKVGNWADCTIQSRVSCAYCTMPFWRLWWTYAARTMLEL